MSFASGLIQPGHWPYVAPIILLFCSNLFMTLAWYGHLKFKAVSLVIVVLVSWGIAFVEYCFAVPANRIGSAVYSPAELKTIQEELGMDEMEEFTQLRARAEQKEWTQDIQDIFEKEMAKLERYNPSSPDYSIQYNYINSEASRNGLSDHRSII